MFCIINLVLSSVGKAAETIENIPAVPTLPEGQRHLTFNVGDKVKVLMDIDTLKGMQEGHGGWNPRMAEVNFLLVPVAIHFRQPISFDFDSALAIIVIRYC